MRDAIARSVSTGTPFATMPRSPPTRTPARRLALLALAARRLDLAALRNAPLGQGVDDIVDALTRVAVDDADADADGRAEPLGGQGEVPNSVNTCGALRSASPRLAALRNAPLGQGVDDIVDALTRVAVDDADADADADASSPMRTPR